MQQDNRPTLQDIVRLAQQLGIILDLDNHFLHLDTPPHAQFALHRTYTNTEGGILAAFGDLVRYRDRKED